MTAPSRYLVVRAGDLNREVAAHFLSPPRGIAP